MLFSLFLLLNAAMLKDVLSHLILYIYISKYLFTLTYIKFWILNLTWKRVLTKKQKTRNLIPLLTINKVELTLYIISGGEKIHLRLDKLLPLLERNPWRYKPSKNSKRYDVTCHIYSYIHKKCNVIMGKLFFINSFIYVGTVENGIFTYSCVFFLHGIFSKTKHPAWKCNNTECLKFL